MATRRGSEEDTFYYFAYGSNLMKQRILINNPSAVRIGAGRLEGFRFVFSGYSNWWGGATANILPSVGSHVCGAVWRLSKSDLPALDRQEIGYNALQVSVRLMALDRVFTCRTYTKAKELDQPPSPELDSKPSAAYKWIVLTGAQESQLPEEYIKQLDADWPDNGVLDAGPPTLKDQIVASRRTSSSNNQSVDS